MVSPDPRIKTPGPEFAELKFAKDKGPTYDQKLDAFEESYLKKGKSYGSIAANNVVSLVSGIAELGEHYSIPLFKPFAAKIANMDLDPNYDDAIEKMKNTIRNDPQGFIKVAASGALDEFKQATEQGYINYFAEGAVNYIDHFSTSAKQLFTETIKDYAKREKIDLANATDEEITHLRSLALYNALVVSEAIPASQVLKTGVNVTGKVANDIGVGIYNSGKGIKEFLDNNFPPSDGNLIPISSGINKNVNTGFKQKNLIENINQIFVPVQGEKTKTSSGLILKDPDLSKIKRRFGWGSKFSYRKAKRNVKNIYKDFIYPKALDAKGDIFNDIKLLQEEDQILVTMLLNENWIETGWMPGKNNVLFTEIDDSGIKFNYPINDAGEFKNLEPYNTMLHKMYLHALNPKSGDPVVQLQDLIKHEDLFILFPELKSLPIKFTKDKKEMGINGHYVPENSTNSYGEVVTDPRGMIELNIKNLVSNKEDLDIITNGNKLSNYITPATQESIISTLFHEIQHVIQSKNNFLSFGRHSDVRNEFNIIRAENVEKIVNKINTFNTLNQQGFTIGSVPFHKPLPDYYIQFYRNGEYDIVSDLAKLSPTEYPTLATSNAPAPIKLSPKAAELLAKKLQYDLMEKVGAKADDFMTPKMFEKESKLMKNPVEYFNDLRKGNVILKIKNHFTYFNDLMETESRLVQARLNLPFDKRKEIPPFRDYVDAYRAMRTGEGAVSFSASKPSVAQARITIFDLLMTSQKAEIKFNDLTSKGGIDPSKMSDLEKNINETESFLQKLQKNIKNSSLLKDMEANTFSGDTIEKGLKGDDLSKKLAQAIVFQDFHKVFFAGLTGDLSKDASDPFIDGLKQMGLETIVPQIQELQSKYINTIYSLEKCI